MAETRRGYIAGLLVWNAFMSVVSYIIAGAFIEDPINTSSLVVSVTFAVWIGLTVLLFYEWMRFEKRIDNSVKQSDEK